MLEGQILLNKEETLAALDPKYNYAKITVVPLLCH